MGEFPGIICSGSAWKRPLSPPCPRYQQRRRSAANSLHHQPAVPSLLNTVDPSPLSFRTLPLRICLYCPLLTPVHSLSPELPLPCFARVADCMMIGPNGLKREATTAFDNPLSAGNAPNSGGGGGGAGKKIRRALAACKNCRKQKTRCDHTGGAPCHRCKVLG